MLATRGSRSNPREIYNNGRDDTYKYVRMSKEEFTLDGSRRENCSQNYNDGSRLLLSSRSLRTVESTRYRMVAPHAMHSVS
jgi:hypothetical protein